MKSTEKIFIRSKIRNYQVLFTDHFNFINNFINKENIFFIDERVFKIYKNEIFKNALPNYHLINAKEESKTLDYAKVLYSKLINSKSKKKSSIIAIGGGVVQDISGFVASTFYRGINWVYVPTTLLAQSDSCIGSKTSINFNDAKNMIGTFYPPKEIYININFIDSLSEKDFESGIGEIIKIQLTNIKKSQVNILADKIKKIKIEKGHKELTKIIYDSLNIKKIYIEKDEYDKGARNLLNYGHTLGHAIESTSNFKIPHGTAVLIGIIYANLISAKRKLLQKNILDEINNKIIFPNINKKFINKDQFSTSALLEKVKSDKKRTGNNLSFIIPNSALKLIKSDDVSDHEFIDVLNNFRKTILPILTK